MTKKDIDCLSRGREAFLRRDYDLAIKELHDLSLLDNAEALTMLAESMNRTKSGRDFERIFRIWIMAANLGSVLACLRVAEEYYLNQTTLRQAEEYFLIAARLGSNLAHKRLSEHHLNTGDSSAKAARFLRAARHGDPNAMFEYGRLVELGIVEPSYERNLNILKTLFEKDRSRRTEAQDWYVKAAFAGSIEVVGHMMGTPVLRPGKPIMKDIKSSRQIVEDAARNDDVFGLTIKGYWLLHSEKLTRSNGGQAIRHEAFTTLLKAAHKGNHHAMGDVGNLYYQGYGVERNFERALAWSLYAIQCDADYAVPVEGYGLLLCDIEKNSDGVVRRNKAQSAQFLQLSWSLLAEKLD